MDGGKPRTHHWALLSTWKEKKISRPRKRGTKYLQTDGCEERPGTMHQRSRRTQREADGTAPWPSPETPVPSTGNSGRHPETRLPYADPWPWRAGAGPGARPGAGRWRCGNLDTVNRFDGSRIISHIMTAFDSAPEGAGRTRNKALAASHIDWKVSETLAARETRSEASLSRHL